MTAKRKREDEHSPANAEAETEEIELSESSSTKGNSKKSFKDEEGRQYWQLGPTRRVTVSEFRSKKLVDIREFYEKNGKQLPGKKGIALSAEQFQSLLDVAEKVKASFEDPVDT